jgi:hypothetical protein
MSQPAVEARIVMQPFGNRRAYLRQTRNGRNLEVVK